MFAVILPRHQIQGLAPFFHLCHCFYIKENLFSARERCAMIRESRKMWRKELRGSLVVIIAPLQGYRIPAILDIAIVFSQYVACSYRCASEWPTKVALSSHLCCQRLGILRNICTIPAGNSDPASDSPPASARPPAASSRCSSSAMPRPKMYMQESTWHALHSVPPRLYSMSKRYNVCQGWLGRERV